METGPHSQPSDRSTTGLPPVRQPPAWHYAPPAARVRPAQAGAPNRFGLGTIMVVTASYALLVTFLRLLNAPTALTVFLLVFVSMLGVAQALLFKGRDPRLASLAMGTLAMPLFALGWMVYGAAIGELRMPLAGCICSLVLSVPLGAAGGYLLGACVAGVFLLMNRADHWLHHNRRGAAVVRAQIVEEEVR